MLLGYSGAHQLSSQGNILYIVGPTASGKTALSIELAKEIDAEIVCADSQTVRQDMNIGTAKPTKTEMRGVVHHMIDIIDPYAEFNLKDFIDRAMYIINDIHKRNKNVIVVGGTGLYIDALFFRFALPQLSYTTTDKLADLNNQSIDSLHSIINATSLTMPPNSSNPRHLINVILRAGKTGQKNVPDEKSIIIGINPGREVLLKRINTRVDSMFDTGFIEEVRGIIKKYGKPPRSFDAIGYRIAMRLIEEEIDQTQARELFKIADRQYAKRQLSWFKRNGHIKWFESPAEAKEYILKK